MQDDKTLTTLAMLNGTLDECMACQTIARGFKHVPGAGYAPNPNTMFVFINPTTRNISARADWPGLRMPFAGKPKWWSILAETGFVPPELPQQIAALGPTATMVDHLIKTVQEQRLYLTNAVKCVDDGSNLPIAGRVQASLPQLQAEINFVQPRLIITMGLLPFAALTGHALRLSDQLWDAQQGRINLYPSRPINGRVFDVFPCYFPTGRGNPVAATKMLRALHENLK